MKRLLFLLIFSTSTLVGANAFAKCMSGNVSAAPNKNTVLPANASVIVTFYGTERAAFSKKKKKTFFFKSGKEKVEAKLVKEWNSEAKLKALHFKAAKNLTVGKTYDLNIHGKKFSWKIGKADTTKPKWVASPKQLEFKKVELGCGPAVNFIVSLKVTDASPMFYDVVMKTKNGKTQRFFVQSSKGKMRIGHSMCSGQFVPPQGNDAQVIMTPYDFAGNKGEKKTITLTSK